MGDIGQTPCHPSAQQPPSPLDRHRATLLHNSPCHHWTETVPPFCTTAPVSTGQTPCHPSAQQPLSALDRHRATLLHNRTTMFSHVTWNRKNRLYLKPKEHNSHKLTGQTKGIRITWNNKTHYFLCIYFNNMPLHDSSRLAANHEEDQLCIWYMSCVMLTGCWLQPLNITHDYTNCCLYRVDPPDDEQQACPKHVEPFFFSLSLGAIIP